MWRAEDPQGNESAKVKWEIVPYTRGKVLDLGCGAEKTFPHFTGVDSCKDTALFGARIDPDVKVETCERLTEFETESCDAVFSSHLLEHIPDYRAALKEWWRVVKTGGFLVLYLPHKQLYPNVGQPGANPDHVHDFEPLDVIEAMRDADGGWDLVERQIRSEDREYSFLLVFQKKNTAARTYGYMLRKTFKRTACVVRYGGFGDMLQAANVLPALKRQGYRVTVMTIPKGQDVLREDPHVDAWYIQDEDQVPNHELTAFWAYQAKKFTKFINLSESVEGTLLAMEGRANHAWPDEVRHEMMNLNYLEFTAKLAGVPYLSEARFYATAEEEIEAAARLLPAPGLNLMFALAGSSIHKFYPGQDHVIARILLEHPDCRVFLVGDGACKLLEQGWENEPRVVCLSGELTIRQTLALANVVDAVIGAETGVLNAVAFNAKVRKVVLLSHSSVENLTKHWRNTAAIEPQGIACYPCHRLHYSREFCHEDKETGAAICQRSISPDQVFAGLHA